MDEEQHDLDHLEHLQGRIIALELLAVPFIIDQVGRGTQSTLVVGVDAMRRELKSSLQHLGRPIDEASDRIWSQAIGALDRIFDNAANRAVAIDAAGEAERG